jgi:peptidylprolyl isomerase
MPSAPTITLRRYRIIGLQEDPSFQQCAEAARYVNTEHPEAFSVAIERCLPFVFERERRQLAAASGAHSDDIAAERVLVLALTPSASADDKAVLTAPEFLERIMAATDFRLFNVADDAADSYRTVARREYFRFLRSTGHCFAWILLKKNDQILGRLTFELFTDKAPFTCQNFLHLCRGDLPDAVDAATGEKVRLSYKKSRVFRIVKGGWIQAGDITPPYAGNGGRSTFANKTFPDESFDVKHDDEGILGMANDGEHTAASSFYVTVGKSSWMNGRYVAFGRVIEGLDLVRTLHGLETKHSQAPKDLIEIDECGQLLID